MSVINEVAAEIANVLERLHGRVAEVESGAKSEIESLETNLRAEISGLTSEVSDLKSKLGDALSSIEDLKSELSAEVKSSAVDVIKSASGQTAVAKTPEVTPEPTAPAAEESAEAEASAPLPMASVGVYSTTATDAVAGTVTTLEHATGQATTVHSETGATVETDPVAAQVASQAAAAAGVTVGQG